MKDSENKTVEVSRRYTLVIEGKEHAWSEEFISVTIIAKMGGWDLAQGVIEIDENNVERNVPCDEAIRLCPGHSFGKKHRWKRG